MSIVHPIVVARKGQVTANSRDVAELFGRDHKNVLQALDRLECSDKFRALNFQLTTESRKIGATTRTIRSFSMTKDGFVFLVMGFTGKQAARIIPHIRRLRGYPSQ